MKQYLNWRRTLLLIAKSFNDVTSYKYWKTVTFAVPGVDRSAAFIAAVNCVELTKL
jgi:hypothetical protein